MADGADQAIPLSVDLDGTLLHTDMLHESLLLLAKTSPTSLVSLPGWLLQGKARFKHLIAEQVTVDAQSLPYRAEVLALINQARAEGRPVVLATASPAKIANAIADHLGLFDDVLSSDDGVNLSAQNKASLLTDKYGEKGFDYIGNDSADLPVFAQARRAILVSSNPRLRRASNSAHEGVNFFESKGGGVRAWMKALRLHQWIKNLLIFVPLVAGHEIMNLPLLLAAIIAFLSFSLCASSVYLLNDLLDLTSDRAHHRKKGRPFASGALPVLSGIVAAPGLLVMSLGLALFLPPRFIVALGFYYAATTLYSFWLKKKAIADVMLLASLYTLRIIAGAAAVTIKPSFWLLALSMFIFLGLAMVKRYSELRLCLETKSVVAGRGYHSADLPVLLALGSASGMISVLILALYTQAEIVPDLYPSPEWLWFAPALLLYWTARLWMKTVRGEVHDDPVVFAARDWQSLVIAGLMGMTYLLASSAVSPW